MSHIAAGEIERIVREVLAEMSAPPLAASQTPAPALAISPLAASQNEAPLEGDLLVTCRLVTMAAVAERLASARRLVVPPGAVVTPAVRDELQRRRVPLVRAASPLAAAKEAKPLPRLVLMAARARRDPAALAEALGREGVEVCRLTSDCLIAATDQLAGEVTRPGTLGLLWTRHTAAGLCLANRHPALRAVLASDRPGTAAAVQAVAANVLVLDPAAVSGFQQRQIVGEFCRGGVHPCPEKFKNRLG
jgi:ribose 5-phosphate isomerase RpiB